MPTINDRIGSQNVIRVLSNASAPPTRIVNLQDIDSTRKDIDGQLLVWNLSDETFYMTNELDSTTLMVAGITTFSNTTASTSLSNGALIVSGGAGIAGNLNIGGDATVVGVVTFSKDLDINAAIDVLSGITVTGITTLNGLLDINSGADVVGVTTFGSLVDVNNRIDVVGGANIDQLNVTGVSSFVGVGTFSSDLHVGGNLSVAGTVTSEDVVNIDSLGIVTARHGFRATAGGIHIQAGIATFAGAASFAGIVTTTSDVYTTGTFTAGLIDGGTY